MFEKAAILSFQVHNFCTEVQCNLMIFTLEYRCKIGNKTSHPHHPPPHLPPFLLPQVLLVGLLSKLSLPPQMGLQLLLFQAHLEIPLEVGEEVVDYSSQHYIAGPTQHKCSQIF